MNPDVTITISTAGDGATGTRGPAPSLAPDTADESWAGPARGPTPLPLDELPGAGVGALTTELAGAGAPPVPATIESIAAMVAGVTGSAPMPMDLDTMTPAPAGLPTPQDLEAMAATPPGQGGTRRRSRKTTSR